MGEIIDVTPLSAIDEVLKDKAEKKILIDGVGIFSREDANDILVTFETVDNMWFDEEDDDYDDELSCEVYEVNIDHVYNLKHTFKNWVTDFVNQPDSTEAYRRMNQDILHHGLVTAYMDYLDTLVVYDNIDTKKVILSEVMNVISNDNIFIIPDNKQKIITNDLEGVHGDYDGW